MAYDLTGKVKVVQDAKTFGSGFTVREFVVSVEDGQYTQDISLQCVQDKVSLLDNLTEGQQVKVSFDIRGRYNEKYDRYFNNLQAWKIEAEEGGGEAPAAAAAADDKPPLPADDEAPGEMDDDIPF